MDTAQIQKFAYRLSLPLNSTPNRSTINKYIRKITKKTHTLKCIFRKIDKMDNNE